MFISCALVFSIFDIWEPLKYRAITRYLETSESEIESETMKFIKLVLLIPILLVIGCTPDYVKVDLYTSDFTDALKGKIIEVPTEMQFSGHLGDDEDKTVPQVIQLSKKYLGESAEYTRSKGQFGGEVIVIKTVVPMGLESKLNQYMSKAKNQNIPFGLVINSQNNSVTFNTAESMERFNKELLAINFMLQMEMIPTKLTYNIVSDEKTEYQVMGFSVFVNGKPHLKFEKSLKKRESVALDFSGEDGSIWKTEELRPWVNIFSTEKK